MWLSAIFKLAGGHLPVLVFFVPDCHQLSGQFNSDLQYSQNDMILPRWPVITKENRTTRGLHEGENC